MLRVQVRGAGIPKVVLGSGDTLLFGRNPDAAASDIPSTGQVNQSALQIPRLASHVSRVVGELIVGEEVARLRWRGSTTAQHSSLLDAPGRARRVELAMVMRALPDQGE